MESRKMSVKQPHRMTPESVIDRFIVFGPGQQFTYVHDQQSMLLRICSWSLGKSLSDGQIRVIPFSKSKSEMYQKLSSSKTFHFSEANTHANLRLLHRNVISGGHDVCKSGS